MGAGEEGNGGMGEERRGLDGRDGERGSVGRDRSINKTQQAIDIHLLFVVWSGHSNP